MVPTKPNTFASKMLRVKGRASSAVAVSEENLFSTLPVSRSKEGSHKLSCWSWQAVLWLIR